MIIESAVIECTDTQSRDIAAANNSSIEYRNIRTPEIDGDPYFFGKDVAAAPGYRNTSDALKKTYGY